MHRALLRGMRTVLGLILTVWVGGASTAAIVQTLDHGRAVEAHEVSQQEIQFWQAVAGEGSDSLPVVASLFARDLNEIIDDPEALDAFYGTSNRYGGVTTAIGFDPFDETGLRCSECGPLDDYTRNGLDQIADGGLNALIRQTEVPGPDNGYTLTPFGWSFASTGLAIWLVGGPLALGISSLWTQGRLKDLGWSSNGSMMVEKVSIIMLAPTFMFPYLLHRRSDQRRFENRVRAMFPEHMALIDQTNQLMDGLEPTAVTILKSKRDQIVVELEAQTRSNITSKNDPQLAVLLDELNNSIEYLRLRAEAKNDIDKVS